MFCENCGTALPDDAEFCEQCGTPAKSAAAEIKQEKAVNVIPAQPAAPPSPVAETAPAAVTTLSPPQSPPPPAVEDIPAKKKHTLRNVLIAVTAAGVVLAASFIIHRNYTSKKVSLLAGQGLNYVEKEDYDNAISKFNEAISLSPNGAWIYNYRGEAFFKKGQYDTAIKDFDKAISLDTSNALYYKKRADAYLMKSDYFAARDEFGVAISLSPNYPEAYASRGFASSMIAREFDGQIRLDPNHAEIGIIYASRASAYNMAVSDLEKALSLNPNYTWAKNYLHEISGWGW